MGAVAFVLEGYFAAMLGVSGLAKLEHPQHFARTLLLHRMLPSWSVVVVSRTFPWLEVLLATLLLSGIGQRLTSVVTLVLFTGFLAVEIVLVLTKRATNCGCYGVAYARRVDGAALLVSSVLIALALAHLWLVFSSGAAEIVGWWRGAGLLIFGVGMCWLGWRVLVRRRGVTPRSLPAAAEMVPGA